MVTITKAPHSQFIQGFIPVPRPYQPAYKIEITPTGKSAVDITSYTLSYSFTRPVTYEVGRFEIRLENSHEGFTNSFEENDTVEIYLDNNAGTAQAASVKKFKGKIEEIKKTFIGRNILVISGIHESGDLLDIHVTASFDGETVDNILKSIISDFADSFTTTNISTFTTTATINWSEKPFWECVIDLCEIANADCYVDDDKDFHFFARGSNTSTLDTAYLGPKSGNILDVEGLGKNIVDVKNKVIVYGDEEIGIQWTAEDDSTTLNVKEKIITDSDIKTISEAKKRADAELLLLKTSEIKGNVKVLLLPFVNPGDKMWISVPMHNIQDKYRVINLKYKFEESGLITTEVDVAKQTKGIPQFFRDRMSKELGLEKINNPNKLKFSYPFTFDDDTNIENHAGTETSDGLLQLQAGQTEGIMTTSSLSHKSQITQVDPIIIGTQLGACIFKVSADNGVNYDVVSKDTLKNISVPGNKLKYKIELRTDSLNSNPQVSIFNCKFS